MTKMKKGWLRPERTIISFIDPDPVTVHGLNHELLQSSSIQSLGFELNNTFWGELLYRLSQIRTILNRRARMHTYTGNVCCRLTFEFFLFLFVPLVFSSPLDFWLRLFGPPLRMSLERRKQHKHKIQQTQSFSFIQQHTHPRFIQRISIIQLNSEYIEFKQCQRGKGGWYPTYKCPSLEKSKCLVGIISQIGI